MDDLKNIVIQNLEQEGTLGSLRAQLRARVFKAIENYADTNAKQAAGFQWQNPAAAKVHEDPDHKLVALLVKDFLEHYKMDYTLSVYCPEVAI
jgi:FGFR1 oncogene partner